MEILEGKKNKEVSEEKIDENTDVDLKDLENKEAKQKSPDDGAKISEESEKSVEKENETENDSEKEDENKRFIDLSEDDE